MRSRGKLTGVKVGLCNSILCNAVLEVAKLHLRKSDVALTSYWNAVRRIICPVTTLTDKYF